MPTSIDDLKKNQEGYYDRTETGKFFDKHVFIAGRILQSAEMNEIQSTAQFQLKNIADALFKDGDIVRDCRANIPTGSQSATIESGAIYIKGQVRGVPEGQITVPATGTVSIGIWLVPSVITEQDDNTLLDPATGNRGFNEPGAYRLQETPEWGLNTDSHPANDTFYPVYYVDDGQLRAKEPPPNLDAVTQAIARYDVDSNGSNYVVSGLRVMRLDDDATTGDQVYSVQAGRARVNGFGIQQNSARRQTFTPKIDLKEVNLESNAAMTIADAAKNAASGIPAADVTDPALAGKQWVPINHLPLDNVSNLTILTPFTANDGGGHGIVRVTGTLTDKIPVDYGQFETISAVKSAKDASGTTYVAGTDFNFVRNSNSITWLSGAGAKKPADGNTYYIEGHTWLRYALPPEDIRDNGVYVKGAVIDPAVQTTTQMDYFFRLPRIDRLVVDETGSYNWIVGIATDGVPVSPPVPSNVLSLCQVVQAWTRGPNSSTIINDGVRMVSMTEIENMNTRLDNLTDMVAQVNLISDINVRDAGAKKGLFVDPFVNDDQRDMGRTQELSIAGGCLQLPISAVVLEPTPKDGSITGVTSVISCDSTDEIVLRNEARTSEMKVNPYMAFGAFPGTATLTPQIDRWVYTNTQLVGTDTRYFTTTVYAPWSFQGNVHGTTQKTGQVTTTEFVNSTTAEDEYLRARDVNFTITGFLPTDTLTELWFDGVNIINKVSNA
ncbi:DUF4815 domain-containing protein [Salmonella enterica]|nr:DUF4815 domain-containing protein [Salmonella enterica]